MMKSVRISIGLVLLFSMLVATPVAAQQGADFKYFNETVRAISYTADFQYFDVKRNITIIEELKSSYTAKLADYRIRARLFQYKIKDRNDLLFIEIIK